jgi:hypothetical protein
MYAQCVEFRIGCTLTIIVEAVWISAALMCTPHECYIE